ncbi:uncharacterized protein [Zea mays]|nr:uncharacterized protein LOC103640658 [Zea mays]|eukprot:XP_008662363.1 uncharacterized protein LOC103640658 [Zea mays]
MGMHLWSSSLDPAITDEIKMLELPFVMGALIKPLAEKLNEDSSCADFLGKSMLIWLYAAISCLSSSLQPEESTSARYLRLAASGTDLFPTEHNWKNLNRRVRDQWIVMHKDHYCFPSNQRLGLQQRDESGHERVGRHPAVGLQFNEPDSRGR